MSLTILPDELLLLILREADCGSIARLNCCSQQFYTLINDAQFWKIKINCDFPEISFKKTETLENLRGIYKFHRKIASLIENSFGDMPKEFKNDLKKIIISSDEKLSTETSPLIDQLENDGYVITEEFESELDEKLKLGLKWVFEKN